MPIVEFTGNVKHDGVDYKAEQSLEVTEEVAKSLVDAGVAKLVEKQTADGPTTPPLAQGEQVKQPEPNGFPQPAPQQPSPAQIEQDLASIEGPGPQLPQQLN